MWSDLLHILIMNGGREISNEAGIGMHMHAMKLVMRQAWACLHAVSRWRLRQTYTQKR